MMPQEKQRVLALFDQEQRWCQHAEARDGNGEPVCYDDEAAVAWDLTGAICRLFGWQRACELFRQLDRHICGAKRQHRATRDPEIDAMAALQEYNDRTETTYETVVTQIRSMSVWRRDPPAPDGACCGPGTGVAET